MPTDEQSDYVETKRGKIAFVFRLQSIGDNYGTRVAVMRRIQTIGKHFPKKGARPVSRSERKFFAEELESRCKLFTLKDFSALSSPRKKEYGLWHPDMK